ncbi:scavenger receptor cysteine-rich type 1 protein M130-like, partial [Pholidichthys leucotaenia]
ALYGDVEAPVGTKEFQCGGNESALLDCRSSGSARNSCSPGEAVGLTCSEPVRLVGGDSRCGGTVEVKHLREWRPVEGGDWYLETAAVVCEHLDCGSAVSVGERKESSERAVWRIDPDCGQSGSSLRDCLTSSRSSSSLQTVSCSGVQAEGKPNLTEPDDDVRLVGGDSCCSGELEVKHQGQRRPVEGGYWTLKAAAVVCEHLDCGSAVSVGVRWQSSERDVWGIRSHCVHSGSSLTECARSSHSQYIQTVTCSDSVRLLNGTSVCSGRLEVKSNQSWSSVCQADFDQQDAEVVCRELGCGPPLLLQGALYGDMEAPVGTKEFQCGGDESALLDCRSSGSARKSCSPGEAVGLTCSEPVRLVGGDSHCGGTVEVEHLGEWRPVEGDGWPLKTAAVVCEHLDCGSAVSVGEREESSRRHVWWIYPDCVQSGSSLRDCLTSSLSSPFSQTVSCSGVQAEGKPNRTEPDDDVRLVGGDSRCSGELEVKHQGQRRPVDPGHLTLKAAAVVCKHLDCGSAVSVGKREESSERDVWEIGSHCLQSGSSLTECVRSSHSQSIQSVTCSDSSWFRASPVSSPSIISVSADLLFQPNISASINGVSQDQQQDLRVPKGSSFTISCSIQPQYPGGSFQLTFTSSDGAHNHTRPAVNHSADFLFAVVEPAHQGSYSCVYHVSVFSHNFSSESGLLSVTVPDLTGLIIRGILLPLVLLLENLVLWFYWKVLPEGGGASADRTTLKWWRWSSELEPLDEELLKREELWEERRS